MSQFLVELAVCIASAGMALSLATFTMTSLKDYLRHRSARSLTKHIRQQVESHHTRLTMESEDTREQIKRVAALLDKYDNIVATVENVAIIRSDGRTFVKELTAADRSILDQDPTILRDPERAHFSLSAAPLSSTRPARTSCP